MLNNVDGDFTFSKTAIYIILNCKIMRKSPLQIEDLAFCMLSFIKETMRNFQKNYNLLDNK